jgi:hypothetical protein
MAVHVYSSQPESSIVGDVHTELAMSLQPQNPNPVFSAKTHARVHVHVKLNLMARYTF